MLTFRCHSTPSASSSLIFSIHGFTSTHIRSHYHYATKKTITNIGCWTRLLSLLASTENFVIPCSTCSVLWAFRFGCTNRYTAQSSITNRLTLHHQYKQFSKEIQYINCFRMIKIMVTSFFNNWENTVSTYPPKMVSYSLELWGGIALRLICVEKIKICLRTSKAFF